ncbi:uncharacterized protein [Phyllobates terribilis]|uniref:uncharacterized protein n=1 Tax=Phyllobates terribilis TaxID=111132 RepID=UPI003CCAFB40
MPERRAGAVFCVTPYWIHKAIEIRRRKKEKESDAIMRIHGRPRYGQRLLVKALSSCKSIGFSLLTRFRKSHRKWRTLLKDSFQATKSATITAVRRFRSVAMRKRKDHVISQDSGEKNPTYIVVDTDSTSSIAESGEDLADPVCAQGAHEGQQQTRPRDNLKRKAPTSEDSQPEMLPPAKRAATENLSDLLREVTPEMETPQVDMPDIGDQEDNLSPEQLTILLSKGEEGFLDYEIVIMAQDLLQSQFEGFDGLQPPCALLVPGYSVLKNAVQIHYDEERVHWLTTCYKNGQIFVADSMNSGNLSQSIREQIINMYREVVEEPLKHLTFIDVDQQKNYYDCGLFAIAFAYELMADGGEPRAEFRHRLMRNHLISCLQNGRISAFPKKNRK